MPGKAANSIVISRRDGQELVSKSLLHTDTIARLILMYIHISQIPSNEIYLHNSIFILVQLKCLHTDPPSNVFVTR